MLNAFCLGLFRKVKKGTLLIDSSTIDPAVSKEMAIAAEKMGAVFMDAPVSGGNFTYRKKVCIFDFVILWCSTIENCTVSFFIMADIQNTPSHTQWLLFIVLD